MSNGVEPPSESEDYDMMLHAFATGLIGPLKEYVTAFGIIAAIPQFSKGAQPTIPKTFPSLRFLFEESLVNYWLHGELEE